MPTAKKSVGVKSNCPMAVITKVSGEMTKGAVMASNGAPTSKKLIKESGVKTKQMVLAN